MPHPYIPEGHNYEPLITFYEMRELVREAMESAKGGAIDDRLLKLNSDFDRTISDWEKLTPAERSPAQTRLLVGLGDCKLLGPERVMEPVA